MQRRPVAQVVSAKNGNKEGARAVQRRDRAVELSKRLDYDGIVAITSTWMEANSIFSVVGALGPEKRPKRPFTGHFKCDFG